MSQSGIIRVADSAAAVDSVVGANGVTASPTTGAVVVSGVNATTSSVGVASFNSAEFTVTAGAVSLVGGSTAAIQTINSIGPDGTGNFQLLGTTNQVTVTPGANRDTLSLSGPYTPATYTAHGVLLGEGSGSIVATAAGTTGQVLTGVTGADPTWQSPAASGITTINGNSGSATGSTVTITTGAASTQGTSIFTASGSTLTHTFTDANSNTGLGLHTLDSLSGGLNNTALGVDSGTAISSGNNNTSIGQGSLSVLSTNSSCSAFGQASLNGSTGSFNSAFGANSLGGLGAGTNNIALGYTAGNSYASTESSNICIGNTGTAAESNVIRIGVTGSGTGQQNKAFLAGVTGVTNSNAQMVTVNSSTGQMGAASTTAISSTGAVTNTGQPAFCVYLASTLNNKTGNGTNYNFGTDALTKLYDQTTNVTTGGVFTAPITGIYRFDTAILIVGTTIATVFTSNLLKNGSVYCQNVNSRAASGNNQSIFGNYQLNLTTGDTIQVQINVAGEASDSDDIYGQATPVSFFSGALVC